MRGYIPTWSSLKEHNVPKWYDDAKLGIFIHWGPYSVPAWAPTTGELGEVPQGEWFENNPYAEWYLNSLRIKRSPTWKHHVEKYGKNFDYYKFVDMWKAEKWDPKEWVELFKKAGAKYVIPTTKHHDGFCLWPSKYTDFNAMNRGPKRDLIGELAKAVKDEGLKFGVYYSGALDWRFTKEPITTSEDIRFIIRPHTYEYSDYAYKQFEELIEKYKPDILWNDIGWPEKGREDLKYLFAHFYNKNPEGVVNDRWDVSHWDFKTPEYKQNYPEGIPSYKWELCRGLGFSFGYNQNESDKEVLSSEKLIYLLVEVVSKGGNLLLNVGPKADGTIPEIQRERLLTLGKWLEKNGEAIYDTTSWNMEKTETTDGTEVRFTRKDPNLYCILLGTPQYKELTLKSLRIDVKSVVTLMSTGEKLKHQVEGENTKIFFPRLPEEFCTTILKISPV